MSSLSGRVRRLFSFNKGRTVKLAFLVKRKNHFPLLNESEFKAEGLAENGKQQQNFQSLFGYPKGRRGDIETSDNIHE